MHDRPKPQLYPVVSSSDSVTYLAEKSEAETKAEVVPLRHTVPPKREQEVIKKDETEIRI